MDDWTPSKDDIREYFNKKGWPTFESIRYDHIDNDKERQILETAVSSCREYADAVKSDSDRTPSMILLASQIDGDLDRTGYGCGKTTLAKIIHYASGFVSLVAGSEEFNIYQTSKFYESRKLMGMFDEDRANVDYMLRSLGRLLIIDDVGREGTLRWERRDPELQLEEKQDRYYTIINRCYEKGIGVLLTSNLTSREMAAFLGGASWSRLLQMVPKKYRINMTGLPDMRPILANTEWF